MNEFEIPPISTLAGSTLLNYLKILRKGKISVRFYWKLFLTTLIILISTPFQAWEHLYFQKRMNGLKFKKAPLFILGHWRSGTTLIHNLMAQDPSAGFISTYQSLFPNNLASKWIFKTFMRINMPKKRPTDNVKLNVNFPQEDEFAFSNCQPNAYYNFFYFPENYRTFFEKSILHKNLTQKEVKTWYKEYDRLIKKALINTGGERVIIKNPVNTGRIDKIVKLYPDAKFLYIYRNPYTVFFSTQKFFYQLFPTLWLHKTTNEFIDKMIFEVYVDLMELYEKQKSLIPPENIMEIRFEDLEMNPLRMTEKIYNQLLKEDFRQIESCFSNYIQTQKSYRKNRYTVTAGMVETIEQNWGKYIAKYGYQLPDEINIETV